MKSGETADPSTADQAFSNPTIAIPANAIVYGKGKQMAAQRIAPRSIAAERDRMPNRCSMNQQGAPTQSKPSARQIHATIRTNGIIKISDAPISSKSAFGSRTPPTTTPATKVKQTMTAPQFAPTMPATMARSSDVSGRSVTELRQIVAP